MSVSMAQWLSSEVREDAEHHGETLSHWLADAAQTKLRARSLERFLETWESENGPFTPEELDAAAERLGPVDSPPSTGPYRFEIASSDESAGDVITAIAQLVESGHRVTVLLGDDQRGPSGNDESDERNRAERTHRA